MLMPDPDRAKYDSYLTNYLTTGEKKIIGSGREVTGLRKDGSKFPMDLAVSEALQGGRCIFTGIVRDITERREAEKAIQESALILQSRTVELEFAREQLESAAEFASALNRPTPKETYRSALECIRIGCDDYLSKPVSHRDLVDVIRKHVDAARARTDVTAYSP